MEEIQQDTIQLLIVSDIHRAKSLAAMKRHRDEMLDSFTPTYLVNCGDMIFIDYHCIQSPEEISFQENLHKDVMSYLETFGCPHIFVPGNHDLPSVYTNEEPKLLSSLEEKSTNLHNRCVKIADNLWMIGFGGSVPRYHLDGSVSKYGYPYEKTDMEEDTILKLLDLIPEEDYVILLTHCPPDNVGSGIMFKDKYANQIYKLGSQSMCKQIFEAQRTHRLFLNIHGHVHPNPGMNWFHSLWGDCCVVNPGNISGGKYARMKLKKTENGWRVTSFENCFYFE